VRAIGKPIDDANAEAMSRHWQVTSSAEELVSAAETVKDNAEWMCDEKDLEHLAVIKAAIREAKEVLSAIEKDIDPDIAALMGEQQVQVGEFRLERRGGKNRKQWQSGSLWSELCRRSRFDPDTGEELSAEAARERLVQMTHACVPFTGSLGWRTTALRSYGLDPDEYAEVSPAPWRVEVHRVTDEGVDL
jgi:hypothetical protein